MAEPKPEFSDLITQAKKKIVPKFTEIFPVEDVNYPYGSFIAAVRKDVVKYCTDHKGIFQPVLPPEKKVPELWFYTQLKTKTSSITLAIRMDNLYLVGFRTPAGVWWEFGKTGDTHLLDDNPRWLGFGGRYQDLIGNKGLETVTLGRAEMTRAVNDLAKKTTMTLEEEQLLMLQDAGLAAAADPQADTKSKLAKLVVMVCEGVRFNTVSRTVEAGFNKGVTISEMQGKQVQKWDRISKAAFDWAKNPNAVIPDMQKLGIKDKNEAARIVALVKNQTTATASASATYEKSDV
ncbi:hypothetical protein BDA96_02G379600 [Sorghum bicolor]|jgi:hypothetical protein|uniref:rRNA N-glycosylase n=2 Tax=Sorghum bicolor TaxID=4558 RepID=A0A921RTK4_SORBI|nr:ribosome-inactivating protein 9 [Sorghum bicolor]EER99645.1 hypothetical protein SORBI_3002G362400 [Sorghum bicolor]KAG0545645.1 hypothetical protein BDA96_02G379600 [Sorghum bicolor]|eukprot:XP_002463124.1 ribosome-inactivating protein 9 [Sorghum bicolor]